MRFTRFVAIVCILSLLNLMVAEPVLAVANPGYRGLTIGGGSVALVPGGPSGLWVNTFNGNLAVFRTDLRIPGRGLPLEISLTYNSNDDDVNGPFGFGWRFSYGIGYILQSDGDVVIIWGDGRTDIFDKRGTAYVPTNDSVFATLEQDRPNSLRVVSKEGIQYFFEEPIHRRVTRIQDPNGNAITFTYATGSPYHELSAVTDAAGRSIFLTYNRGKVDRIIDPNTLPARSLLYSYDDVGNLVRVADLGGDDTSYRYDIGHRMTQIADPLGTTDIAYTPVTLAVRSISRSNPSGGTLSTRLFGYDPAASSTAVTDVLDDARTATTLYTYDANRRLVRTTDPLGHIETRTYDALGNTTSITDRNNGLTVFEHDARGNIVTITDPRGQTASFTYDGVFSRMASFTDPNGHTATSVYDDAGNLSAHVDPVGNVTRYYYDTFGQAIRRENARGFSSTFTYNAHGDLIGISSPLGDKRSFTYDGVGNLIDTADPNGQSTLYSYDARNRRTGVVYPDGSEALFAYNWSGSVLSAVGPITDASFTYDAHSRLLQSSDNLLSKTIYYDYDGVGNRVRMVGPEGKSTSYGYDLASRVTTISREGQEFAFDYDASDRLTRREFPNGSFTAYSYDAADNILTVVNRRSDGSRISQFEYEYDNAGNQVKFRLDEASITRYQYDRRNQLVQESRSDGALSYTHRFTYDAVGNRTSRDADGEVTAYEYSAADRLLRGGSTSYQYDANGNQIGKISGGASISFRYDSEDRLVEVAGSGVASTYRYDVFGRRAAKTVGAAERFYLYDGLDAVAEYSGGDVIQAEYLFGLGVDDNLAFARQGDYFYYFRDNLNSIREIVDTAGTVQNRYDYDAWGNVLAQVEGVANDYTFTGRQVDKETGLHYYRARTYDSSIGRFIQSDPIDVSLGRSLYLYVDNEPVSFRDPTGELFFLIPAIIKIVQVVAIVVTLAAPIVTRAAPAVPKFVSAAVRVFSDRDKQRAAIEAAKKISKGGGKVLPALALLGLSESASGASNTDHTGDDRMSESGEGAAGDGSSKGDADGDGDVDRDDVEAIFRHRGQPGSGHDDPRDMNGDGKITVNDARIAEISRR